MKIAVYLSIFLYFLRRLFRRVLAPARKLRRKPDSKYPCHINLFQTDSMGRLGRFYHVGPVLMLDERTRSAAEDYLEKNYGKVFSELGDWIVGIGTDDEDDGSFQDLLGQVPEEDRVLFKRECWKMIYVVKKAISWFENA